MLIAFDETLALSFCIFANQGDTRPQRVISNVVWIMSNVCCLNSHRLCHLTHTEYYQMHMLIRMNRNRLIVQNDVSTPYFFH